MVQHASYATKSRKVIHHLQSELHFSELCLIDKFYTGDEETMQLQRILKLVLQISVVSVVIPVYFYFLESAFVFLLALLSY